MKATKILLTCLIVQNARAIKFTDKNNNCFNLQTGKRHISLKRTDCTSHIDLQVDNNKCVLFEDWCIMGDSN